MKVLLIFLFLILILCYLKKQETFIDQNKIKTTLESNWGGILDIIPEQEIKTFENSNKFSVSNIIRTISCKNNLFSYQMKNKILLNEDYQNKIIYDHLSTEHINNTPTGLLIGNDFSVDKNNTSYGIVVTFNPEETKNNFAYIGIEMKSKMNLKDLNNISQKLSSEIENPRKVIEIFHNLNATSDLLSYFTRGDTNKNIEYLGIFEEQNNIEFIRSLQDSKFNLLDLYGNTILTGCKVDIPYCNIELPVKGNIKGRNGYIVGKYSPENKAIVTLKDTQYQNKTECLVNKEKHKEAYGDVNNTQQLALDNLLIKNDSEFINKYLIGKTDFKCRKHNSKFNNKYYFGGINTENQFQCFGDEAECNYYENEAECTDKSTLENKTFVDLNPLLENHPVYVPKEEHEKYNKYKELGCIRTSEQEAVCKHIHNKMLSDVITFTIDECEEKNAKQIIESREVINIRHPEGIGPVSLEQETEYYKNKFFIESYNSRNKNLNPMLFFEKLRFFIKLQNYYDRNEIRTYTVAEIIEVDKNGVFISNGFMLEDSNIYKLNQGDQIYTYIKDNKMVFYIISSDNNNIVVSRKTIDKKIEGKFGETINYYLATNNKNIFENPRYTQNVSNYVIPYLADIKINVE